MPHHTAADLETVFDPDFGEAHEATITTDAGSTYSANVIINRDFEQVDQDNNLTERVVVLEFLTHLLPASLVRNDVVTVGGESWTIERLINQDTYVSRYAVS